MRAGSAPALMASRTAAARVSARASISFASAGGAMMRQPASIDQVCHCGASAGSTSAIEGVWADAAAASARLMPQTRANAFRQFLDLIGFLDGRQRKDVGFVLFDILLEVLRH